MYWIEGVDSTSEGLWVEVSRLDVLIPIVQLQAVVVEKKNYILCFKHTVGLGHGRNSYNSLTTKCYILLSVFKTAPGFVCDRPIIKFPRPVELCTIDYNTE